MFPHESGIVMQRGVEMGMVLSTSLVAHSLYLLNSVDRAESPHPNMDLVFEFFLLVRVISAIPRPYLWLSIRSKFIHARAQATPQQVAEALLGIYNNQTSLEKFLLYFYYIWLLVTSLLALFTPFKTPFGSLVWGHLLLNFTLIISHRVVCIAMFYYLVNSDLPRGINVSVINKASRVEIFSGIPTDDDECSICYAQYTAGDTVRVLQCGHEFHVNCVDEWLTRHRNKCPVCLHTVGPNSR